MVDTPAPKTKPQTCSLATLATELGQGVNWVREKAVHDLPGHFFVVTGRGRMLLLEHRPEAAKILRELGGAKPGKSENGQMSESGQIYTYASERARREHYEAEYSQLKLQEKRQTLLNTKEVQRAYTDAVSRTSTRILQVPRQLCAELVGLDAGSIERLMDKTLREALRELKAKIGRVQLVTEEAELD